MDDRFPKWLRVLVRKLDFIGVPNLGGMLCALAGISFLLSQFMPVGMDRFVFDPQLVLQGEWWRLITFPLTGGFQNGLYVIFYVMYLYFVMNALEGTWGPGPTTVYILFTYLAALAAAFITQRQADVSFLILQNVSLAFGTMFPNYEMLIYFVLPVKAKWLSFLAAILLAAQLVRGGFEDRIFIVITLLPYLVFFGPLLIGNIRNQRRLAQHRKRFDNDMFR